VKATGSARKRKTVRLADAMMVGWLIFQTGDEFIDSPQVIKL
jgi:hypothetical protein